MPSSSALHSSSNVAAVVVVVVVGSINWILFCLCILRRGAAIKLRDRLGRTAFNVAIESGNEACAHFLYQVGS